MPDPLPDPLRPVPCPLIPDDPFARRVRALVAQEAKRPIEAVVDEATLEGLGLDSLDAWNLALAVEDELALADAIEPPADRAAQSLTVAEVIALARQGRRPAEGEKA